MLLGIHCLRRPPARGAAVFLLNESVLQSAARADEGRLGAQTDGAFLTCRLGVFSLLQRFDSGIEGQQDRRMPVFEIGGRAKGLQPVKGRFGHGAV